MAYPENEGREVRYEDERNAQLYRLRGKFSLQLLSLLRSNYEPNLVAAEQLFGIYLRSGNAPHPTHLLDKKGNIEPELAFGLGMLASKELVLNRFATIANVLEQDTPEPVAVPVTDDLPQFTTLVRSMFPPEADTEVMGICQNGLVDGWNTMLDLLGREDVPLAMFPKTLGPYLRQRTEELYPSEKGIVLPTALSGVQAKYDYSNEFVLPYISLTIEPSQAA